MNLAILHYHLDRGGVTRVIENHLRSLDATATGPGRAAILFGGRAEGWSDDLASRFENIELSRHVVPSLEYDADDQARPDRLAFEIGQTLRGLGFRQDETVLHIHNHSLGKNLSLPGSIGRLAADGWRLLLQIHDFAEDFRPANFQRIRTAFGNDYARSLYPQAAQIHYALLNQRDLGNLGAAGVADERIHLLPNPVLNPGELPDRDAARRLLAQRLDVGLDERFVLSPVRGIRRKNVGELLLLSVLDSESVYGLTLVPRTPAELKFHDRWRANAAKWNLPVRFATGESDGTGLTFAENLAAADEVVTTSVAEGFGMAFLEPWLAGKPLRGRDLPAITGDFAAMGIRLDRLYPRIAVPVDWLDADHVANVLRTATESLLATYGRPQMTDDEWSRILTARVEEGTIDFGDLDEEMQESILQRIIDDRSASEELRRRNPAAIERRTDAELIAANARQIRQAYGLEPSGRRLRSLYNRLLAAPVGEPAESIAGELLLDRFLDLTALRLIRSGT